MSTAGSRVGHFEMTDDLLLDDRPVVEEILALKRERNAVILVHNYQPPGIQEIGDYTGDSLGLARKASSTAADVIVFCGVHFMAETAHILSPEKTVLLPERSAGCPLADMAGAEAVREARGRYPRAVVVSYVNTSAAVKAESDYCCTSSNAARVVEAVPGDEVLFVPDRNLAAFVAGGTAKRVIPWDGYCPVHEQITVDHLMEALGSHPGAEIIAHPECRPEVLGMAHHVRSTSGMAEAAASSQAEDFIVATEEGMLYPLGKSVPHKRFYAPPGEHICSNMKVITLRKVLDSLKDLEPRITVPKDTRLRALGAVERMIAIA